MNEKNCLITGATGGIGKATAIALARQGAHVVLACREHGRGEALKAEIVSQTGNSSVEVLLIDLADLSSIRQAATAFNAKHDRLDVLLNVAAVYKNQRTTTRDGLETMFAVNHLAPFLLTTLLLDKLKASAPSRILNVTAPSTTKLNFDDLQGEKNFRSLWAFGETKMANLLFTYKLARDLKGTGVTVNAIHPGLVRSNLMQESPPLMRWLTRLMSGSADKAAESLAFLALSQEVAGMTGKFFKDKIEMKSDPYSYDTNVQDRLWQMSAALIKQL
jgi:NAD(P)-dependent dehydrogenase (short-subunit alcohol dehydrogenase family)